MPTIARQLFSDSTPLAPGLLVLFALLAVVDVVAKGYALWASAKSHQKGWFIALLMVNSIGILPLIYLSFFQKKEKSK